MYDWHCVPIFVPAISTGHTHMLTSHFEFLHLPWECIQSSLLLLDCWLAWLNVRESQGQSGAIESYALLNSQGPAGRQAKAGGRQLPQSRVLTTVVLLLLSMVRRQFFGFPIEGVDQRKSR